MEKHYKPIGYNSVSPYFLVDGAQKMVDLLKELFNVKVLRSFDTLDGSIMHMEVLIDDSVIMLGESSEQFSPNTHLLHVYVPNVDETFEKAIALGCVPIETPKERKNDPDKRGTFKDFAGNIWSIGTQL